ncbi:hypothetical protein EON82_13450 [bacterium]|nr:MAG: hypothetical protein EON82_13450 [bacterium]
MRPHQIALILAAVVSLVGMVFPPVEAMLLPLRLLSTHIHELGHALAALGTGGTPQFIKVFGNGSGVTPVAGGFLPLVASAGYLGAAAAGAAVVYAMRTEQGARRALGITGFALAASLILFVRGDIVGVASGVLWAAVLIAAAKVLRGSWLLFAAGLIGLQQGINSLRSLSELLQITAVSESHSDARLMQQITYVPAMVWAALWGVCGLAVIALTVRRAWAPRPAAR